MIRIQSKTLTVLLGGILFAVGAFSWQQRSRSKEHSVVPRPVAALPESQPGATQPRVVPPALPALAEPVAAVDQTRAEKTRLAAEGEAQRIAIREKRLDQLDWAAPRPEPAADGEVVEGKSERAMSVSEKIRQKEILIQRLKQRVAQNEQGAVRPASTAFDSKVLTARLQRRITELEQSVDELRHPQQNP